MANSMYATDGTAGINLLASGPTPSHRVGQHTEGVNNTTWVYCLCSAAVTGPGYAVSIDPSWNATMITTANAGGRGAKVGFAPVAMASGDYGWFQISGPANIRVAASTTARTRLNTTTTAGQLGTDATTGSAQVEGTVLVANQGGSAGLGAAIGAGGYQVTANN